MADETIGAHKAVYLTYSILADDGEILERTDVPVGYVHGSPASPLFPQVASALEGHAAGDEVRVRLAADEAFGNHLPELTWTDNIDNVPPPFRHVGAEATFANERGETRIFRVTHIADGQLTLDGNHPLAGRPVTFVVRVERVREATPGEISAGNPADSFGNQLGA